MSDPHKPEEATRESGSAVSVDDAPRTNAADEHDEAEDSTTSLEHESDDDDADREAHAEDHDDESDDDTAVHAQDHGSDDDDDDDQAPSGVPESSSSSGSSRTGLFAAIGVAALAVIGVLVLLAAFVWPDFTGPGKPDDAANQAVSALSAKDPGALDKIGCKRTDGKPSVQLPPQILQLIQSATPSGPPKMTLDYEARQTINLTLGAQGQSQSAPVDMVLAVSGGSWCLNNIEAGQ